jgi:hypothetical protein
MPNYTFILHGQQHSSSEDYARMDVERKAAAGQLVVDQIVIVPEFALCVGSERPATNVTVDSNPAHPYNQGRCRGCGVLVPLASMGSFEVIKHFAPSNYPGAVSLRLEPEPASPSAYVS